MSEQGPGGLPAGWYDDPQSPESLRYWDGHAWTGAVEPRGVAAASAPAAMTVPETAGSLLPAGPADAAIEPALAAGGPADWAPLEANLPGEGEATPPSAAEVPSAGGAQPATRAERREQARVERTTLSIPPAARKWAAIGGAGVLVLAGLGLAITRPWDTTPETCAEAVAALAGGSTERQTLNAVTEKCRSLDEFADQATKYPDAFAVDGLESGVAGLCDQVPGAADRPLCAEVASAPRPTSEASPAPQA